VGSWSDDISMELATIDSIINKNDINYDDIMNNFMLWIEKGTPVLKCGNMEKEHMSNGSLMRILPIALYSYVKKLSDSEIQELTNNVSALTHRHESVQLACFIYVMYVIDLLNDIDKDTAYMNMRKRKYNYSQESIDLYSRLLKEDISDDSLDFCSEQSPDDCLDDCPIDIEKDKKEEKEIRNKKKEKKKKKENIKKIVEHIILEIIINGY